MMKCTRVIDGQECGGEIVNGRCKECRAKYANIDPDADGALKGVGTAARRTGTRGTGRRDTLFVAIAGTTQVFDGQLPFQLMGSTGERKRAKASTTTLRAMEEIAGNCVALPSPKTRDPLTLVKPELLEAALSKRVCPDGHALFKPDAKGNYKLRLDAGGNEIMSGRCPTCGKAFDISHLGPTPFLPGELIAGQYRNINIRYEGGQGWVFVAYDEELGRHVILKVQKAVSDRDAAISLQEKQNLVRLNHNRLPKVYGFKRHRGMSVMVIELIDGENLEDLMAENGGKFEVDQALALGLDMALSTAYINSEGFIACDLKGPNFMKTAATESKPSVLVQVDAGAWRLATDLVSPVQGTPGFAPPEIMDPKRKPKPVLESDQFSATVTVLTLFAPAYDPEANMFQVPNLPEFKDYPSLHGWAVRGMALDPLDRFPSMEVWSEQLFWVLREVLAINGKPRPPLISNYFGGDNSFGASALDAKYVPDPRLDESDSAFGELEATIGFEGSDAQRLKTLEQIVAKFPSSREAKFRLAWQQAKSGDFTASSALLKQLGQEDTEDWRNSYYRGLVALLRKDWGAAVDAFKSVRKTLPGEPGAKLALAIARELKGDYDEARANYGLVVISSPEYTYAAFRFAALMLSIGKRVEAIQALRRIPTGSVAHLEAEMQVVRALASNGATLEDLDVAAKALVAIENDQSAPWHLLAAQVLETALDGLRSGTFTASNTTRLLDCALQPRELRLGCELHLMSASQFSATDAEKDAHWARAIELRPLTAV